MPLQERPDGSESSDLERLRPFEHLWLLVGHADQLTRPGDFLTQYMGEDPVVVVRDRNSRKRVFLNRCRHRGVVLCPFDRGNARWFTCSFHGWTYGLDGALMSLQQRGAQPVPVASDRWNLIEAPRVDACGRFVFASWDADAAPLDDFLGSLRDKLVTDFGRSGGTGLAPAAAPRQRVTIRQRWDGEVSGWQQDEDCPLNILGSLPGLRLLESSRIPSSVALEQWHPRGPHEIESWLQVLVEPAAPESVRQESVQRWQRLHARAGVPLDVDCGDGTET